MRYVGKSSRSRLPSHRPCAAQHSTCLLQCCRLPIPSPSPITMAAQVQSFRLQGCGCAQHQAAGRLGICTILAPVGLVAGDNSFAPCFLSLPCPALTSKPVLGGIDGQEAHGRTPAPRFGPQPNAQNSAVAWLAWDRPLGNNSTYRPSRSTCVGIREGGAVLRLGRYCV
jgi:hypothetical protein